MKEEEELRKLEAKRLAEEEWERECHRQMVLEKEAKVKLRREREHEKKIKEIEIAKLAIRGEKTR